MHHLNSSSVEKCRFGGKGHLEVAVSAGKRRFYLFTSNTYLEFRSPLAAGAWFKPGLHHMVHSVWERTICNTILRYQETFTENCVSQQVYEIFSRNV